MVLAVSSRAGENGAACLFIMQRFAAGRLPCLGSGCCLGRLGGALAVESGKDAGEADFQAVGEAGRAIRSSATATRWVAVGGQFAQILAADLVALGDWRAV